MESSDSSDALLGSDISSSSSSSDTDEYNVLNRQPKHRNEHFFNNAIGVYSDSEFFEHFRVSRAVANDLARRLEGSRYYFHQVAEFGKISALQYILIFLWFAGHEAASYRDVADRFDISLSSLRKIIVKMIYFLSNLSANIIDWPDANGKATIERHFRQNGFPGVIGAIDGSHVRIDKPEEDPNSYIIRKHFYSIHLQVVCDHKRKIRDVSIGFPGSVHDSRVFRASSLSRNIEEKCGDYYLLGDSGYPCLPHLLTPYRDMGNLGRVQTNFNVKLSKNRYVIEHCFGILKQKFRQLYHLKLRKIRECVHFIRACCVLHNLALNDELPENLEENPQEAADIQPPIEEMNEGNNRNDGFNLRNRIANMLALD